MTNAPPRALQDLRVIEIADGVSGPFCARLLADLGADVVKIEPPGTGDSSRRRGPFAGGVASLETSLLFMYLNANKSGVTLNLETPAGRDLAHQLLVGADVLVESCSASSAATYGIVPDRLLTLNPRLVVVSVTPYGRVGPYADYRATELVISQTSGPGYITPGIVDDEDSEPPIKLGGYSVQMLGGFTAAVSVMNGVLQRQRTGTGCHVDMAVQEAGVWASSLAVTRYLYSGQQAVRGKGDEASRAPVVYPCRDGYFCMSALADRQWTEWLALLGNPPWATDPRFSTRAARGAHGDELVALIGEWTMQRDKEEICRLAQARGIPATPLNNIKEVVEHPHFRSRGFFVEQQRRFGGTIAFPGFGYRLSETPGEFRSPAPELGEHTVQVLTGRLGLSQEDVRGLWQAGVV